MTDPARDAATVAQRIKDAITAIPEARDVTVLCIPTADRPILRATWTYRDVYLGAGFPADASEQYVVGEVTRIHQGTFPYLRPLVRSYARAMEEQMRANDWKGPDGGWRADSMAGLIAHLRREVDELTEAVENHELSNLVIAEAADVGNLAAMIADQFAGLATIPR